VPVNVVHADGEKTIVVNEKRAPEIEKRVRFAGHLPLHCRTKPAVVTVTTANTDGYVVVDAIQLLPAD
jgi:hypothetical protein